jgi:class 3 adenylate cyclase/sensor domain CHASE-containing protein
LLTVLLATLGLVCVICIPLRAHVLGRFEAIERGLAADDLDGARNTLQSEAEAVGAMARDYAVWDETYAFAVGGQEGYVATNLGDNTLTDNQLSTVLIVDEERRLIYGDRFDRVDVEHEASFAPDDVFSGPADPLLARADADATVFGLQRVRDLPYMVGAHAILTSNSEGPPHGTLVFGRALDEAELERLRERVRLDMNIVPLDAVPSALSAPVLALEADERIIEPIDDETLGAYALLRDLRGEPVAMLQITIPRTVYAEGRSDANVIAASVGAACLVFGLLVLLLLEQVILRRVSHLGQEVGVVGAAADHSLRVSVSGSDELSGLARTVNEMLTSLERLNVELDSERAKAEALLRNILPGPIAERLKDGEKTIADQFPEVSVLFADLVGFTTLSSSVSAQDLVVMLNDVFSRFDNLADEHGLEKIKTIGDAYMVVAGLPEPRPDHALALSSMALDMLDAIDDFNVQHGTSLGIRIGINTGPVVAGVIGKRKFIYDLWGDAVNVASRMESSGLPGRVQISDSTQVCLAGALPVEDRGTITVKGKGEMQTWLLAVRLGARAAQ